MQRKALLFYFSLASRELPLGAYEKRLCCFGKSGGTRSGTHSMNFKKSNKQLFLWSLGFNLFSVKIKEKCLTYIKEFAVFGIMLRCQQNSSDE